MAAAPPKPVILRDLHVSAIAITGAPSNDPSRIVFFRHKSGGPVAELPINSPGTPEEFQRAKVELAELKEQLASEKKLRIEREAREEKIQCGEIVKGAFPLIRAKDVDSGDLLYRIRRAAKATGDEKLETDFLAVMRTAQERAKAADGLTRSIGISGQEEPTDMPADVQRAIEPFLKEKGVNGDVRKAISRACIEATKNGNNATYELLTTFQRSN